MSVIDRWLARAPAPQFPEQEVATLATSATMGHPARISANLGVADALRHSATSAPFPKNVAECRNWFATPNAAENKGTQGNVADVADVAKSESRRLGVAEVADVATASPINLGDLPKGGDLDERAALVEIGAGVPREWAEGFAALSTMATPEGFSPARWQRIVDSAGHFLDRWAVEAAQLGWSALDVFGVHSERPDARFDAMGLIVLLDRSDVTAIDPEGATLRFPDGVEQRYRRRPLPPGTVSLWDLTR